MTVSGSYCACSNDCQLPAGFCTDDEVDQVVAVVVAADAAAGVVEIADVFDGQMQVVAAVVGEIDPKQCYEKIFK